MTEPTHPLLQWLTENEMTREELCCAIGISKVHLSQILRGIKRPSLDTCDKITLATGGAIRANQFQRVNI